MPNKKHFHMLKSEENPDTYPSEHLPPGNVRTYQSVACSTIPVVNHQMFTVKRHLRETVLFQPYLVPLFVFSIFSLPYCSQRDLRTCTNLPRSTAKAWTKTDILFDVVYPSVSHATVSSLSNVYTTPMRKRQQTDETQKQRETEMNFSRKKREIKANNTYTLSRTR